MQLVWYLFASLPIEIAGENGFIIRIVLVQILCLLVNIVVKCLLQGLFGFETNSIQTGLNGCLILHSRSMIQETGTRMSLSLAQKKEL